MDKKFEKLAESIIDADEELALEATRALIADGTDPLEIFTDCVQSTLNELGDRFGRLEIFLPELILSSEVVQAIQTELKPLLAAKSDTNKAGTIVIGTAFGDVHDIGKNMVSLLLEVNGFEVHDLGISIEPKNFIDAAESYNADIIAISALMLPTLPYMKDTIDMVNASEALHKKLRVMVGGGPVNQMWADEVGADGYSNDALEAVELAKKLIAQLRG